MGQVFLFWDSTGKRYIYKLVTKEKFCDKTNLSTLSKLQEAMKIHASTSSVSTNAIPKLDCGLDQMNWQEVETTSWYLRLCRRANSNIYSWWKWSSRAVRWKRWWVLCWRVDRTIQWRNFPWKQWVRNRLYERLQILPTNLRQTIPGPLRKRSQ